LSDEVAPFSAARHSAQLGTNAFISPRSFGCGCAALSDVRAKRLSRPGQRSAAARHACIEGLYPIGIIRLRLCPAAI